MDNTGKGARVVRNLNRRRCNIMAAARSYREPGRCEKFLRLERMKVNGIRVWVCTIHRNMLSEGRKLEVVK